MAEHWPAIHSMLLYGLFGLIGGVMKLLEPGRPFTSRLVVYRLFSSFAAAMAISGMMALVTDKENVLLASGVIGGFAGKTTFEFLCAAGRNVIKRKTEEF